MSGRAAKVRQHMCQIQKRLKQAQSREMMTLQPKLEAVQRNVWMSLSPYESPTYKSSSPPMFGPTKRGPKAQADSTQDLYSARLLSEYDEDMTAPVITARQVEALRGAEYVPVAYDTISAAGSEPDEVLPLDQDPSSSSPTPPNGKSGGGGGHNRRPANGLSASKASPAAAVSPKGGRSTIAGLGGSPARQSPGALTRAPASDMDGDSAAGDQGDAGTEAGEGSEALTAATAAARLDELGLLMAETPLVKLRAREKMAEQMTKAGDAWGALRARQEVLALAKVHVSMNRDSNPFPLLLPTAHYKLAQAYAELGCVAQVAEHSQRAMDELPYHGHALDKVAAFKREVNILMGEALLQSEPPQPQVALQHFMFAADVAAVEDIKDLGIRVLACQCMAMMGEAKLSEARATREARARLEQAIANLEVKIAASDKKSIEKVGLVQRAHDLQAELDEETAFEAKLVAEAEAQMDKAMSAMFDVIPDEEERLKKSLGDDAARKHPLMATLYRQACELSIRLSTVYGLKGDLKAQLGALNEVLSAQAAYGFLPVALEARALKEKGAVLVEMKKYDEALEVYNSLLELQAGRYQGETARLAIARGECFKLVGDVYVAKRQFNRAREHFEAAVELYAQQLGPRNSLVVDLEHRINQIRGYAEL